MTDSIILIVVASNATRHMLNYAEAAAERALENEWQVMALPDCPAELIPMITMVATSEDAIAADETAMELCDKVLLIGHDERIQAMYEYLLTLWDKEIWLVTFDGKRHHTMHRVTEAKPHPQTIRMF